MIKVREVQASSIITKSRLPDADYVINPYTGCMHGCVYCYARFMKRFSGHSEEWGRFVDVKINAPDLIPRGKGKYRGKTVLLSSVTDAYLPLEKKYEITRTILERLVPHQPNFMILTKSDLVLRDLDILSRFDNCSVGLTITTLDDSLRREIEPLASAVRRRLRALERLKEAGIRTFVFVGPILPFLTDFREIVLETRSHADEYMFENLNVRGPVWPSVERWLRLRHPDLLEPYKRIYFSRNTYWRRAEEEIREFCEGLGIEFSVYFHHGKG